MAVETADKRVKMLEAAMKKHQDRPDALIEVLHTAQELFGFLGADRLKMIARRLKLPPSQVYGVATFYHFFSLAPKGKHTCVVCMGTACFTKGAAELCASLESELHVKMGGTTPDRNVSLMTARCLGACGIAPVVVLDGVVAGHQTTDSVHQFVEVCRADGTVEAAGMGEGNRTTGRDPVRRP